jgi:UDP:flavonoid glycosyltransferase YjiC (YdhE family)
VTGFTDEAAKAFSSPRMLVTNRRINMIDLVAGATVVLSYGSAGTIRLAMTEGVPLVMIPSIVEQILNANKVVSLGAGKLVNPSASSSDILDAINVVAHDESYLAAATIFARKNPRPADSEIINRSLDVILGSVVERPRANPESLLCS